MFGIKFRTWMESHIVRPRKKQRAKDGAKGGKTVPMADCAQVVPVCPVSAKTDHSAQQREPCKAMTGLGAVKDRITLSPPNHPGFHQPVGNNLSSPESAYSTGYSTDGTSPGAGPEYYINIRTGTHYFLPNAANNPPGSTNLAQAMPPAQSAAHSVHFSTHTPPSLNQFRANTLATPNVLPSATGLYGQRNPIPQGDTQIIYKAPHKMAPVPDGAGHRRTESCDESRRLSVKSTSEKPASEAFASPLLTASPRQRTRIRTNPWLSTNPSPILGSLKPRTSIIESTTSSSSGFKKGGSSSSYGSSCDKLSPRGRDEDSICSLTSSPSHVSTDDDLTLNEMLGKFDESYVYEKETDILSDSDPTDCDETDLEAGQEGGDERDTQDEEELDFIDNDSPLDLPCDVDNGNKGHCTYHDFARKPRYRDSVRRRSGVKREDGPSSPRKRLSTRQDHFSSRKSSRDGSKHHNNKHDNPNSSQSSSKCTTEKKRTRQSVHKSARERNLQNLNRLQNSPVFKDKFFKSTDKENGGQVLNFSRILMQKRFSGENGIGTRSAGNTPIGARKNVGANVVKANLECSNPQLHVTEERDLENRRSNSFSNVSGKIAASREDPLISHASELALIQADKEADRKYRQLILEAEHILTSMKDQIPVPMPKHTTPKPNFITRKFDLDGGLVMPKIERKELPKKCVEKDIHMKNVTKKLSLSPVLPHVHIEALVVSAEVLRGAGRSSRERKEEADGRVESDSDGSLTPKQEDFDDPNPPVRCIDQQNKPVKSEMIRSFKTTQEARWHQESNRRNSLVIATRIHRETTLDHLHREREAKKATHRHISPILVERIAHKPKCTQKNVNLASKNLSGFEDVFLHSRDLEMSSPELPKKIPSKMVKSPTLNGVSRPPLVAFRSIDLGSNLDDSNYCPQSEPVKRKVYTCSATFGRLRKSIVEKGQLGSGALKTEHEEDDSRNSLREKLERLRRERDEREQNKIIDVNNIDSQQYQRHLSLLRRQVLVNTIEGLKRSLEDQSAKLKAAYSTDKPSTLQSKRS